MGVSKNSGTPKWMVKIMENPIEMDDLGVPLFLETPIWFLNVFCMLALHPCLPFLPHDKITSGGWLPTGHSHDPLFGRFCL